MAKKPKINPFAKKVAKDDAMDKKKGIKSGSKKDNAIDKKRGIPKKY